MSVINLKKPIEPKVIETLEKLLEKAKRGEISYIAAVTVEDVIKTHWAGSGNAIEALGAIAFLQNQYIKQALILV